MISSKQQKIYEQIGKYFDLGQKLVLIAEKNNSKLTEDQFNLIEEYIMRLESNCENIASGYLEFLNGNNTKTNIEKLQKAFDNISAINRDYKILLTNSNETDF